MPGNPYDDFLGNGGISSRSNNNGPSSNPFAATTAFLGGPGTGSGGSSTGGSSTGGSPYNRAGQMSSFFNPSSGTGTQPMVSPGLQQVGPAQTISSSGIIPSGAFSHTLDDGALGSGGMLSNRFNTSMMNNNLQRGTSTMPGSGGGIGMGQLAGAAAYDVREQQAAADRQWGRNTAESDAFRQFLNRAPRQIVGSGVYEGGLLEQEGRRQEASGLEDQRRIQGAAEGSYNNVVGMVNRAEAGLANIEPDIQTAYSRYDQAASDFRGAMEGYEDRGAQDASATAAAIRQQFQGQRQMLEMGVRPDGTMMTQQERMAGMQALDFQVAQQVQAALAPILSHYNDTMLSAAGSLSQMTAASGQARFSGNDQRIAAANQRGGLANTLVGAGSALTQGVTAGVNARQQMAQLGSSLMQQASAIRSAAMLNATQLEMQGRGALADMVRANPESVVSTFTALMGLYSLQNAQGANSMAGGGGGSSNRRVRRPPANGQPQQQAANGQPHRDLSGINMNIPRRGTNNTSNIMDQWDEGPDPFVGPPAPDNYDNGILGPDRTDFDNREAENFVGPPRQLNDYWGQGQSVGIR